MVIIDLMIDLFIELFLILTSCLMSLCVYIFKQQKDLFKVFAEETSIEIKKLNNELNELNLKLVKFITTLEKHDEDIRELKMANKVKRKR